MTVQSYGSIPLYNYAFSVLFALVVPTNTYITIKLSTHTIVSVIPKFPKS